MKYLIQINQKAEGPYTLDQIKNIQGVTREHLIWNDSLDNWTRLEDIIEMPLSEDEKLILNSPPTASKVNDIVREKIKKQKIDNLKNYSFVSFFILGIIYGLLLFIISGMIDSGGTNDSPIYRTSGGSDSMVFTILCNTIIYFVLIVALSIGLIWYFVNNSPGLSPQIGSEKNNPSKYLGKWYDSDVVYKHLHFYNNGELVSETSEKSSKGYWWVNENKLYRYYSDSSGGIETFKVSLQDECLNIGDFNYSRKLITEKERLDNNVKGKDKADKEDNNAITLVIGIVLILFGILGIGIYSSNQNSVGNLPTQTQNTDSTAQTVVDTTKKDSSKAPDLIVSKPDSSLKKSIITDSSENTYNETPNGNNNNFWKRVTSIYGYSFEIPSAMYSEPQDNGNDSYSFSFGGFTVTYGVIKRNAYKSFLSFLASRTEPELKQALTNKKNVKILESKTTYINNRFTYYEAFTYESDNSTLYTEEVIQVRNNKLITLMLSSSYDDIDKDLYYINHIRNSLD